MWTHNYLIMYLLVSIARKGFTGCPSIKVAYCKFKEHSLSDLS